MTERFTLLTELGRGGMGVVWKARDEETGQIVALKVMREIYAEDADYVARFERELELAKRINSVHVVKVLGFGVRQKMPYLALEFVDGPSLHDALAQHGPYSWPEARALLVQLAQGLADAHAAGVIHRDVKPSNVLIGPAGIAKLTDFGIARGLDSTRMTATSTMIGTPAYLAPEGPKDARSDLYSLGVIGYQLLTGAPPFVGQTYQEVLLAHIRDEPDLARLVAEARPVIGWLLAKDPANRPRNAWEVMPVVEGRLLLSAPVASVAATEPSRLAAVVRAPEMSRQPEPFRPVARPRPSLPSSRAKQGTGSWALASMEIKGADSIDARARHTATVLPDGRVLFVGGADVDRPLGSAELFRSEADTLLRVGAMSAPRADHAATVLEDGSVLVCGGNGHRVIASAEVCTRGTFVVTGSMLAGRELHTATSLPGGAVLVAGGRDGSKSMASAELYDPTTGLFKRTASMSRPRDSHTATRLPDGRILVVGGHSNGETNETAETYEPAGAWSRGIGPMESARGGHTATLLPNGSVLLTGGTEGRQQGLASAEMFSPNSGAFSSLAPMRLAREGHTATLTREGLVLVVGGANDTGALVSVEAFDLHERIFFDVGKIRQGRVDHTATLLSDGRVLVAGGLDKNGRPLTSIELLTLYYRP